GGRCRVVGGGGARPVPAAGPGRRGAAHPVDAARAARPDPRRRAAARRRGRAGADGLLGADRRDLVVDPYPVGPAGPADQRAARLDGARDPRGRDRVAGAARARAARAAVLGSGAARVPRRQSLTSPSTVVTVSPPTHTAPSGSFATCTRPARPSAVPCAATYDDGSTSPASHCPRPALRLPVTGSSPTPSDGTNARTSTAGPPAPRASAGCSPTTPTLRSPIATRSGCRVSTAAASASWTATQPGPLSIHAARTTSAGPTRSERAMRARSASSTGPDRTSGGAWKARRSPSRRRVTRPTPHSWTTPSPAGAPPASSQACAVPSVGWPANGSSPPGVQIRTR